MKSQGMWAILIVAIVMICIGFYILEYKRERSRRLQKLMFEPITLGGSSSSSSDQAASNPLQKDKGSGSITVPISGDIQTFRIEFEDIGLTLKNGTNIMQGVNGKFQVGYTVTRIQKQYTQVLINTSICYDEERRFYESEA